MNRVSACFTSATGTRNGRLASLLVRRLSVALALTGALTSPLALGGCRKADAPASTDSASCDVTDDGVVLNVTGRGDGIYGVRANHVEDVPLARFERATRISEGVEATSGKRWIQIRLGEEDGRALVDFTANPADKLIAVVAGGEVSSVHKIRQPITSREMQISCCNPRACDRWNALLAAPK